MKRVTLLTLFTFAFLLKVQAQAPQGFNYQAVARDATGAFIKNTTVTVRISILDGATAVYVENHSATTNAYGLFTVKIGKGTVVSGSFSGIQWQTGSKFVTVEVNGNVIGSGAELLSVPYALYANSAGNSTGGGTGGSYKFNPGIGIKVDSVGKSVTISADTAGTFWNARRLVGVAIDPATPVANNVLMFKNGKWTPSALTTGGTAITAGTGISINTGIDPNVISNTGDTDATDDLVDTTDFAGEVSGKYNNLKVSQLIGFPLPTTITGAQKILVFDGNLWSAQDYAPSGSALNAGAGIDIVNNTIINTGDTLSTDDVTLKSPVEGDMVYYTGGEWQRIGYTTTADSSMALKAGANGPFWGLDRVGVAGSGVATINGKNEPDHVFLLDTNVAAVSVFPVSVGGGLVQHTIGIPIAGKTNQAGLLSLADYTAFKNGLGASGSSYSFGSGFTTRGGRITLKIGQSLDTTGGILRVRRPILDSLNIGSVPENYILKVKGGKLTFVADTAKGSSTGGTAYTSNSLNIGADTIGLKPGINANDILTWNGNSWISKTAPSGTNPWASVAGGIEFTPGTVFVDSIDVLGGVRSNRVKTALVTTTSLNASQDITGSNLTVNTLLVTPALRIPTGAQKGHVLTALDNNGNVVWSLPQGGIKYKIGKGLNFLADSTLEADSAKAIWNANKLNGIPLLGIPTIANDNNKILKFQNGNWVLVRDSSTIKTSVGTCPNSTGIVSSSGSYGAGATVTISLERTTVDLSGTPYSFTKLDGSNGFSSTYDGMSGGHLLKIVGVDIGTTISLAAGEKLCYKDPHATTVADDWGNQVVATDTTLMGEGIATNPLRIKPAGNNTVLATDAAGNLAWVAKSSIGGGGPWSKTGTVISSVTPTDQVSIGSATALGQLHVVSTGFVNTVLESNNTSGTWLSINNSGGGQWFGVISTGTGNAQGAGKLMFTQNSNANSALGIIMTLVHSTQRVGIGTANPSSRLHVAGAIRSDSLAGADSSFVGVGPNGVLVRRKLSGGSANGWSLTGNALGTNDYFIGTTDNRGLKIRTAGATRVVVDSIGRLGIGTNSPQFITDIVGTGGPRMRVKTLDASYAGLLTENTTRQFFMGIQAATEAADLTNAGFHIYDNTANARRFVIDHKGNIGLGTSAPLSKVHVGGGLRVDSLFTTNSAAVAGRKMVTVSPTGVLLSEPVPTGGGSSLTNGSGILNISNNRINADSARAIWDAGFIGNKPVDTTSTSALTNTSSDIGKVLKWDGSKWTPSVDNTSGSSGATKVKVDQVTIDTTTLGVLVVKALGIGSAQLANQAVTPAKLANGTAVNQVLKWNGSAWALRADSVGSGSAYTQAGGIGISGTNKIRARFDNITIDTTAAGLLEVKALGIGTAQLANQAVTPAKLANGTAVNQVLKWNGSAWTLRADSVGSGSAYTQAGGIGISGTNKIRARFDNITIDTTAAGLLEVKNFGIGGNQLANNAVTTAKIADFSVTLAKLAGGTAVNQVIKWNGTAWTLRADSVGTGSSSYTQAGGIGISGSNKIYARYDNVTIDTTAAGLLEVKALGIGTAQLAALSVTTAKIANANVTLAKLANGTAANQVIKWNGTAWTLRADSVGTGSSYTQAGGIGITGSNKIYARYDNVTIDTTAAGLLEVKALGIGTAQLAALSVTTAKIAANAVDSSKVGPGALSATDINFVTTPVVNDVLTYTAAGWRPRSGGGSGWNLTGNALTDSITGANKFIGTTDNTPLIFKTNNVETMRITRKGNVSIGGAPAAGYSLAVYGKIKTANITESSDKRLKKDIKPIENALEKVKKLTGVTYKWRKDEFPEMKLEDGTDIGLIAQEVETILPELVNTDEKGFKSIEYSHLVALLIEGMKEQQKQMDALKVELANKETKASQSEDRIKSLESSVSTLNSQMQLLMELVGSKEGVKASK